MNKDKTISITAKATSEQKTIALITTSLAAVAITFMASSLNVALPDIGQEFNASAVLLGWVVGAYSLATAALAIPFGRIADIWGIKKIFLLGTILFTLACGLAFFSNSAIVLIILRAVQGLSAAMVVGTSISMLSAVFPGNERGRALGINMAWVYSGSTVGPVIGGLIIENLGWRNIFLVSSLIGLLVIVLIHWKIKGEWRACEGERLDYRGTAIYSLSLASLMYGISTLPEITGFVLVLIGTGGLIGFAIRESKIPHPILNISVFRNNRPFIFSNLASLINFSTIFAIIFLISLYLQYIKGFSAEMAGLILIVSPLTQTILSPLAGKLSDKIEPRIVSSWGMASTCVGLIIFAFLGNDTPIIVVIAGLLMIGMGISFFMSPNINAIMGSVEKKHYSVAAAVTNTTRCVGQMMSLSISMIVLTLFIGHNAITPEYYPAYLSSMRIIFIIFTVLCVLGILASLSQKTKTIQKTAPNSD